jgi:hypothetical protein
MTNAQGSAEYADNWFRLLNKRVHPLIKSERGQKRIKIAILDTGIQLPRNAAEAYEDQIIECESWLKSEQGNELHKGDRDLDGHGTHCASLLLKVAKNAHIYVARVFQGKAEKMDQIDAKDTQEAIAKA